MASYHHPASGVMQHRPGLTSHNPTYSALQSRSLYGSSSPLSYLNSSLSYKSPYTTYGGTASGYGAVTLPTSASPSHSHSFHQYSSGLSSYPGSSVSLNNERLYPQTIRSRSLHSNNYTSPYASTFGARCNSSLSVQSDVSEGYGVRFLYLYKQILLLAKKVGLLSNNTSN